mmetsp:Transcript_1036/g.2576  ORF Transcript_1036/g.2576 Transcript_1036/m.2576 type:complete len:189 (+) Transcript_1036:3076-3642(+)
MHNLPCKKLKSRIQKLVLWGCVLVGGYMRCGATPPAQHTEPVLQVCFSPQGNCTKLIRETIAKAQKTILVQAYFFTSRPIAEALIKAHYKGVKVHVLVDKSQVKHSATQVRHMVQQGIEVSVDNVLGIAHSKVMIIDDHYVLTGSFNWTQAAEIRNAENLLLIRDTTTNAVYKKEWYRRAKNAQRLVA